MRAYKSIEMKFFRLKTMANCTSLHIKALHARIDGGARTAGKFLFTSPLPVLGQHYMTLSCHMYACLLVFENEISIRTRYSYTQAHPLIQELEDELLLSKSLQVLKHLREVKQHCLFLHSPLNIKWRLTCIHLPPPLYFERSGRMYTGLIRAPCNNEKHFV